MNHLKHIVHNNGASKIIISDWLALHDLRESFSTFLCLSPSFCESSKRKTIMLAFCSQAAKMSASKALNLWKIFENWNFQKKTKAWLCEANFSYIPVWKSPLSTIQLFKSTIKCHKTQKLRRGRKGERTTAQALRTNLLGTQIFNNS